MEQFLYYALCFFILYMIYSNIRTMKPKKIVLVHNGTDYNYVEEN